METIESLKQEIRRLKIICKLADVPDHVVECLAFPKPTEDDIKWATAEIERIKLKN